MDVDMERQREGEKRSGEGEQRDRDRGRGRGNEADRESHTSRSRSRTRSRSKSPSRRRSPNQRPSSVKRRRHDSRSRSRSRSQPRRHSSTSRSDPKSRSRSRSRSHSHRSTHEERRTDSHKHAGNGANDHTNAADDGDASKVRKMPIDDEGHGAADRERKASTSQPVERTEPKDAERDADANTRRGSGRPSDNAAKGSSRRDHRSRSRSRSVSRRRDHDRSGSRSHRHPPPRRSRSPPHRSHVRARSRSRSLSPPHRHRQYPPSGRSRYDDRHATPPTRFTDRFRGSSPRPPSRSRSRSRSRSPSHPRRKRRRSPTYSRTPSPPSRHRHSRFDRPMRHHHHSPSRSRSPSHSRGRRSSRGSDRYSRRNGRGRSHSRSYSRSRSRSRSRPRASKKSRWDMKSDEFGGAAAAMMMNPAAAAAMAAAALAGAPLPIPVPQQPMKLDLNVASGEEAYMRRVAASRGMTGAGPRQSPTPAAPEPLPPLYSIHRGIIVKFAPYGAFVSLPGYRKHGLLHIGRILPKDAGRVDNMEQTGLVMGQEVGVKIISVDGQKIALSMRDVEQTTGRDLNPEHLDYPSTNGAGGGGGGGGGGGLVNPADLPALYSIHPARVLRIESFGAFVELSDVISSRSGKAIQGLLHISAMSSSRRVEKVEDVVSVGEELLVKVIKIDDQGKIGVSLRDVDQATGQDLDPTHSHAGGSGGGGGGGGASNEPPPLYSIHRGSVAKVESFGAFISIAGYRKHGLVHISHLASFKVDSVEKAVGVGESVWVKVIKVEEGGSKVGMSMKYVDQTSGQDLDPQNIQLQADEARSQRSSNFDDANKRKNGPIELGAIHEVDCTRCGARGHLATECMAGVGEKFDQGLPTFQQAASNHDTSAAAATAAPASSSSHSSSASLAKIQEALALIQAAKEAKRAKKEKKRLKKESKKKKHKKHHKKRKYSDSESESSSDSESD